MAGELSPALLTRTRRFAQQLAELRLQSASPSRRPDSPLTASSNEQVVPRTASPDPDLPGTPTDQDEDHQDFHPTDCARRSACPFIPPGFSPRPPSSSFGKLPEGGRYPRPTLIAAPCFHLPREASRREALPTSNALAPPGTRGKENVTVALQGEFVPGTSLPQNQAPTQLQL